MEYLQSLFKEYLGNDVILFTTDGDGESYLKCGTLPSLYSTVDFGPGKMYLSSGCLFFFVILTGVQFEVDILQGVRGIVLKKY